MAETYEFESHVLAIVVRRVEKSDSIEFFTPPEFSQQLGLMRRPAGYIVPMHFHNEVERTIHRTQEVLIVRKGTCKIDISFKAFKTSFELFEGDTVLLSEGKHRILFLEDTELIEIKQGPYLGENDKTLVSE